MSRRYYSSTFTATTLTSGVGTADLALSVGAVSGAPSSVPWTGVIDRGTASEELVTVTNVSGTSLTVTRGVDGTTAKSHSAGAAFEHVISARDLDEANDHVNDTTGDPHPQYLTPAEASAAYRPALARVHSTAGQSIPNTTTTAVTFDAEATDTDGYHDNAVNNTRLTVPAGLGGVHIIQAQLAYPAANGAFHVLLRLNGTTILEEAQHMESATTGGVKLLAVTTERLAAGDYIEVLAYQDTGASRTIVADRTVTFAAITRVGA